MLVVDQDVVAYVEKNIIPRYKSFDKAHDETHARRVIKSGLELAASLDANINMVYIICAYHDLGMECGRENHEINSGIILEGDKLLKGWFTTGQIEIMKEAVEDHRASSEREPRSIYGKIVADADRNISLEIITYRSIQYGIKNFPELNYDEQFQRVYQHIAEKYGEGGYMKMYLNTAENIIVLSELRNAIEDKSNYKKYYDTVYESITNNKEVSKSGAF